MIKKETVYKLYQQIAELKREIARLTPYRDTAIEIYKGCAEVADKNSSVNLSWIFLKFRWLLK